MPDIKTALQEALAKTANEWAADDTAHQEIQQQEQPVPTPETKPYERNSVSRTTFEYIRDNPGLTIEQVTAALVAQGFKENSVSSLCYQMIRVRLVVADANGKMTAVVQQYAPIQALPRKRKAKPVAKAKTKPVVDVAPAPAPRKHVEITNTRTGEVINPRPVPMPVEKEWTPDDVIAKLNVHQALALFKALRNILVG